MGAAAKPHGDVQLCHGRVAEYFQYAWGAVPVILCHAGRGDFVEL